MVKLLVQTGACIFATTLSDIESAAEKCEEDEEGFQECSKYLYGKTNDPLGLRLRAVYFLPKNSVETPIACAEIGFLKHF